MLHNAWKSTITWISTITLIEQITVVKLHWNRQSHGYHVSQRYHMHGYHQLPWYRQSYLQYITFHGDISNHIDIPISMISLITLIYIINNIDIDNYCTCYPDHQHHTFIFKYMYSLCCEIEIEGFLNKTISLTKMHQTAALAVSQWSWALPGHCVIL